MQILKINYILKKFKLNLNQIKQIKIHKLNIKKNNMNNNYKFIKNYY